MNLSSRFFQYILFSLILITILFSTFIYLTNAQVLDDSLVSESVIDSTVSSSRAIYFDYAYAPYDGDVDTNILIQRKLDYIIDHLNSCGLR